MTGTQRTVSRVSVAVTSRSAVRAAGFWTVLVLLAAVLVEGSAAAICWFIVSPRTPDLVWAPDVERARMNWAAAPQADDEIGWPSPAALTQPPYDASGAKYNAEFPQPGHACASAYGDSFVFGADVAPQDGWIERLAHLLGCRVANYGVNAYGTDQTLIRFRRNRDDEAPLVLLGIFPENVLRNVNQYRALMGYDLHPLSVKGRFVLDGTGALAWVPRPRLDEASFVRLNRAPADVLPHEYFLPGTRDGPLTLRFPYTLALLRILAMPRIWTHVSGRPSWSGFFAPDHPAGALPLTVAIVDAFAREAAGRGKRVLVVLFPGGNSLRLRLRDGAFEYAPLAAALADKGIDVFDAGAALAAVLGGRNHCELYIRPDSCGGHFSTLGSSLLAEAAAAELRRRGLAK